MLEKYNGPNRKLIQKNRKFFNKVTKPILLTIFIIIFIYLLSSIDKQTIESIALRLGGYGIVFIGFVLISTQVFAPLSGSAFYFVGIRLYGYELITILFYFTSMISAIICFFIARKWGRRLVIKLVRKEKMAWIDEVILIHENALLIVGRTLGYFLFDFLSYALGLTKISFKRYFIYTAVLTLIPTLILYFIFKNLNFDSFQNVMVFYVSVALTGLLFAYLFARWIKKSRKIK